MEYYPGFVQVNVNIIFLISSQIATEHIYMKYRGSYMSAQVLLNLLNKLGKTDQMHGLPSILSLFRNEFNKFNNTGARMLDYFFFA